MTRKFSTKSSIRSEFKYLLIYQKSKEKKTILLKMSGTFIMHNNNTEVINELVKKKNVQ